MIHLISHAGFKNALHLFGGLSAILLLATASCGKDSRQDVFIVLKEATELDRIRFRGMDQMTYRLKERFPATDAIQEITGPLQQRGWEPLKEPFLESGIPSSHISGWKYYEDHRVGSDSFVYEWSTSWKDKENNVITYTLEYRDPIEKYQRSVYILKPGSSNLKVMAVYMPEKVARAMRQKSEGIHRRDAELPR